MLSLTGSLRSGHHYSLPSCETSPWSPYHLNLLSFLGRYTSVRSFHKTLLSLDSGHRASILTYHAKSFLFVRHIEPRSRPTGLRPYVSTYSGSVSGVHWGLRKSLSSGSETGTGVENHLYLVKWRTVPDSPGLGTWLSEYG